MAVDASLLRTALAGHAPPRSRSRGGCLPNGAVGTRAVRDRGGGGSARGDRPRSRRQRTAANRNRWRGWVKALLWVKRQRLV